MVPSVGAAYSISISPLEFRAWTFDSAVVEDGPHEYRPKKAAAEKAISREIGFILRTSFIRKRKRRALRAKEFAGRRSHTLTQMYFLHRKYKLSIVHYNIGLLVNDLHAVFTNEMTSKVEFSLFNVLPSLTLPKLPSCLYPKHSDSPLELIATFYTN
jgi:hypothetical protein